MLGEVGEELGRRFHALERGDGSAVRADNHGFAVVGLGKAALLLVAAAAAAANDDYGRDGTFSFVLRLACTCSRSAGTSM